MSLSLSEAKLAPLLALAPRIADELYNNILPFWSGPAVDHEQGGWMGSLSNDLKPDRSKPKGLVLHSRVLWTFSAAFRARPNPEYQHLAERAFDYLIARFYDSQSGGAFWSIDDRGAVIDDGKNIYGQAFFIYSLTEFHRSFGSQRALKLAQETFSLIETHAYDTIHGGYFDHCRRDWSLPRQTVVLNFTRLHISKSMNCHLHVLEAYSNLVQIVENRAPIEQRLRELIALFAARIVDPHSCHLHHDFDRKWKIRPDVYTFGHDIEASWLLCDAASLCNDAASASQAREIAAQLAAAVLRDGLSPLGGLYHAGKSGGIADNGHESWPQAEALTGFLNAFLLFDDPRYADAFQRLWQFIEERFSDRVHGEWYWRVDAQGKADTSLPKAAFWKDPYHPSRACLEVLRRLAQSS